MSAPDVRVMSPAVLAEQKRRDNAIKALARAGSIAGQLSGALEALKVSISRNDDELAAVRAESVVILRRRLLAQLEGEAFTDFITSTSSARSAAVGDPAGGPDADGGAAALAKDAAAPVGDHAGNLP